MKKALLARIFELCHEPLYLEISAADLQREISENCWSISATQEERTEATVEELISTINTVSACWLTQVVARSDVRGALFYVWFDEQASQLCCCVISDRNAVLPFGRATEPVLMMEPIIAAFLSSSYGEVIPWDEIIEVEWSDPEEDDIGRYTPLNIYVEQMP